MGLEIVLDSLTIKEARIKLHGSIQNIKREDIIPEYNSFKKIWSARKAIKTARDKEIEIRIEEIAFLLVTDFIFFEGFEFFIVEFFEKLVTKPEDVINFENRAIIIYDYLHVPVSSKTWEHIKHFISVRRKLKGIFEKPFKFKKYKNHLNNVWKSLKELRVISMPSEFTELLDNFSYLPRSLNSKLIDDIRRKCTRDTKEIKNIIDNLRNGLNGHKNFELYHLFEPIFLEVVEKNYSPTKIKNISQCINYIYNYYDIFSSLNDLSLAEDLEKEIIDGIIPLRGYRNFYKLIETLNDKLEFSRVLPSPRKEISQKLIQKSHFRWNDFLDVDKIEKILSDDVPDDFFFYFTFMIFTGVRPSTPLKSDCYEFGYRHGDLTVQVYLSKTNQYAERNLDKLIPDKYIERFKNLVTDEKYQKLISQLNLDRLRRFMKKKLNRADIYVCRRTFVNQLALSFLKLRDKIDGLDSQEIYGFKPIIDESGARSLISTENEEELRYRLDHIILLLSDIMRYSPMSKVIVYHYLNQKFVLLIKKRNNFRDYICQP